MGEPNPKRASSTDMNRGIQNAQSRFERERKGQFLSTQLMEEAGKKRYERDSANDSVHAANDPEYRQRDSHSPPMIDSRAVLLKDELKQLESANDFEYEEGDAEKFIANPPQKPVFPIIMLSVGILKDIVDFAWITGIGMLVTIPVSFLMSVVLFIYFLGKMGGIQRWLWKRYVFAIIISFTPLGALPETTILIFLAYHHENKIVKGITEALERIHRGGMSR